jgi:hypothetical protein
MFKVDTGIGKKGREKIEATWLCRSCLYLKGTTVDIKGARGCTVFHCLKHRKSDFECGEFKPASQAVRYTIRDLVDIGSNLWNNCKEYKRKRKP